MAGNFTFWQEIQPDSTTWELIMETFKGSLLTLAGAGRVTEHRSGALVEASAAFGWHRAPATMEIF
jgi:hypothetical protein